MLRGNGRNGLFGEAGSAKKFKESGMLKLLLVGPDENSLSDLASALVEQEDVDLCRAKSGEEALGIVSNTPTDLVVTDERLLDMTGLEFAQRLLEMNPMINCACVNGLSSGEFHRVSEGLGLLAQLPVNPGKKDAKELLQHLRYIKSLINSE